MSSKVREKGEKVRALILAEIGRGNNDVVSVVVDQLGISRQAVNKHISRLKSQGAVMQEGTARKPLYKLCSNSRVWTNYDLSEDLDEDLIWTRDIRPALEFLPKNVLNIWHHGFTEMFNNAIDHSGGSGIFVSVDKTAEHTEIQISDDGIGIFKKIKDACGLHDERHALFELSKGKLTTDPRNHSGEGIFFTSRMFDNFSILSGELYFNHKRQGPRDYLHEAKDGSDGTHVFMRMSNHSALTTKKIFDEFSSGEDYSFNKTVVPVRLAKFGPDELISRSQAKRLLARVELFATVILDFQDVGAIGQAFADQIFRVFAGEHPDMQIYFMNASEDVQAMIRRARSKPEALAG